MMNHWLTPSDVTYCYQYNTLPAQLSGYHQNILLVSCLFELINTEGLLEYPLGCTK